MQLHSKNLLVISPENSANLCAKPASVGLLGLYRTANFGDLLLADLLSDAVIEGGGRPEFILGYGKERSIALLSKIIGLAISTRCKAIILGGGGYLESGGRAIFANLVPMIFVASLAKLLHRPVGIFGPGLASTNKRISQVLVKYLCAVSEPVFIRDRQSIDSLWRSGVRKHVSLCSDLAHVVSKRGRYRNLTSQCQPSVTKKLLVHADSFFLPGMSEMGPRSFVQALKEWNLPSNWRVQILFDYFDDVSVIRSVAKATGYEVSARMSVREVLQKLRDADSIVSGKFHVALIGHAYCKPVFSFSKHEKVSDLFDRLNIKDHQVCLGPDPNNLKELLDKATQIKWTSKMDESRARMECQAEILYSEIVEFVRKS